MSVIGTGSIGTGGLQDGVCFSTFSHVFFAYFLHFTIFSHVEQVRNLSYKLK